MAKQLVESLASDFEPGQFEDTYRSKVLDLIERKAAGETGLVEVPEIESRREGRRPHGRARGVGGGGQGGPQAPPDR